MQVQQKRVCASCGSESAPDAAFCWRCLVPFAPVPPMPGAVARMSARPAFVAPPSRVAPLSPQPSPPTREPGSSKLIVAIVSIVAALGGYLGVQYLMGPSLSLPDRLAGAERLTDPDSARFEAYTADEGERYGIDAEGGVYGSAATPAFFVILVDAAAAETTDQLFDALVMGFSQAGAVVDGGGATSGTREGSDYRCVGAEAGPQQVFACMWRDETNVGIVLAAPGDLEETRRLLWTVHDTVVG